MKCSRRATRCPICREPLSAAEIAHAIPGEYPTHYACRVALQEAEEAEDDEHQAREYNRRAAVEPEPEED